MAFDTSVAEKVRAALEGRSGVTEKRMFGGIAFLLHGNMCCGIVGKSLMLRLGEEGAAAARTQPHVRPMDFTGRVIKTMVFVDPAGLKTAEAMARWIDRALRFAGTLPPK